MTLPDHSDPARERVFFPHVGETRDVDPGFLEASHLFRVEVSIDEDVLFVLPSIAAVHSDAATVAACMKVQELLRPGHFITHFRVACLDDTPRATPIPKQEGPR